MTTRVVADEQYGKVSRRAHELVARVARGSVDFEVAMNGLQKLIEGGRSAVVSAKKRGLIHLLDDWGSFYHELGFAGLDFSGLPAQEGLVIPEMRKGHRPLILPKGLTIEGVFQRCKDLFGAWKYTGNSLDDVVIHNDRDPKNGAYAILVRDRVEADEELKNLSANQLKTRGIQGITLLERFIYELKVFKETGKHLDIQNTTLCSGSRCGDGDVPSVYWSSSHDGLSVDWDDPSVANGSVRSRQAVSK